MSLVSIKLTKHKWRFGRAGLAVGTQADSLVCPQLFQPQVTGYVITKN